MTKPHRRRVYALNNIQTADDYTTDSTLLCPGTTELNITVGNKAIYIQFAFRAQGFTGASPPWVPLDGLFLPPGFHTRGYNAESVRVKSAVTAQPAQVTIEAVT